MIEALTVLTVALAAVLQAGSGVGFGLVAGPFLIALLGPREGVPSVIVLAAFLNIAIMIVDRRDLQVRPIAPMTLAAVVAIPFFALLVRNLDAGPLAVTGGLLTLLAVSILRGAHLTTFSGRFGLVLAGVVSGGMNVVAAIGGPAAVIAGALRGWSAKMMRPSLQVHFLALNIATLLGLGLPSFRPVLFVATGLGYLVGAVIHRALENLDCV